MNMFIAILLALTLSVYQDAALYEQGVALVEKEQFAEAGAKLEAVDIDRLGRYDETRFRFYRGYTRYKLGQYDRALSDLEIVSHGVSDYEEEARFYRACCLFYLTRYDEAKLLLGSIETRHVAESTEMLRFLSERQHYQEGVDAFRMGRMQICKERMSQVLTLAGEEDAYRASALEWRAEAEYRLGEYEAAELDAQANPYLRAYAQMKQFKYKAAGESFRLYLVQAGAADPARMDAECRAGDCYFVQRRFTDAIAHYGRVAESHTKESDYALYQIGYSQGLMKDFEAKVGTMQSLTERYPSSAYAASAWYEWARAEVSRNQLKAAIAAYDELLSRYPQSSLCPKASVERAMLYRNLGDTKRAIAAYNEAMATYGDSDAAHTAAEGLAQIEAEKADVRTALGAETCYQQAAEAFAAGDVERAEAIANDLLASDTEQDYWLAKALILLSDIEAGRGETYMAEQYLLTLKRNYADSEEIMNEVDRRLNKKSEE